ncbi:putative lipoprotein [Leptospira borgpetersenii str. 200701203]|uniref:Putative lipoprotein n=1 Tax=Leptospira borgpetersenii str. 200701203 TaxID=1193007 RepID=M3GU61_LEPBO|nr:putative lipoprotein [Leptospira borgpetersenii str. 200701203]
MKKVLIGLILVMVVMIGCKPCSDLETKICTDLGEKCRKMEKYGKTRLTY